MAEQPGIMLYFDLAEPLKGLCNEDKGKLLDAMLDYGQYGKDPQFDGILMVVWGFIRPRLDTDADRYRTKVLKSTYSSYCAKARKNNETPLDYDSWYAERYPTTPDDTERHRTVSNDAERYPTTTTTTDSTTTTNTNTNKGEKPSKHKYGEYKNVLLTDEELKKLQTEYPDWQERIEKLSSYVASTGKSYKSHYATIRNWAKKDGDRRPQYSGRKEIVPSWMQPKGISDLEKQAISRMMEMGQEEDNDPEFKASAEELQRMLKEKYGKEQSYG